MAGKILFWGEFREHICDLKGFPGGSDGKESACNVGNLGSIPGLGRSPGGRHGNPLQYSYLENPQGQRSLADHSPWVCKELDTTERQSTAQQHVISKPKALCELPIVKKEQANTINYTLELIFQEEEEKQF